MIDAPTCLGATTRCLRTARRPAAEHHAEGLSAARGVFAARRRSLTGTMCLTEPHCGTDLGLLKTRAEPNADGSYRISGTKIFITANTTSSTTSFTSRSRACRTRRRREGHLCRSSVLKFRVGRGGRVGESATPRSAARSNTRWASTAHACDELRRCRRSIGWSASRTKGTSRRCSR